MHIYVVHPGATFSTSDVYDGLVWGLRANGHTVTEGRTDTIIQWYATAYEAGVAAGTMQAHPLDHNPLNLCAMASAHITRHILLTQPDYVIVVSGHNYSAHDARALRQHGYPVAVVLTESPYFGDLERQIAEHYSVAFTNERLAAPWLRGYGIAAHYLPHAYHPERHSPDGPRGDAYDVVLIGSLFAERRSLIDGVTWQGINAHIGGNELTENAFAPVPNEQVAALYRSAAIALNPHRTTTNHGSGEHIAAGAAESLNPRAYEIPACGGALHLCSDDRAELWDVYGETATTYRAGDSADLERQIRYWLAYPDRREATVRMQAEAVASHHWGNRAAQLMEAL